MKLEFHPLANLFPLIEGDEFDALVGDIRDNGLHDQIDIYQGKILDGRNRYLAAQAAGIEIEARHCRYFRAELYGDPLTYVISKNLKRRHLDESQRAMVAAKLSTMRQGERTDLTPAEPSANLPKVAQPAAAKALSISERALRHARRVQDHGEPELIRAVERGQLAVSMADKASRLSQDIQRRIAAEAERGNPNAARTVIKQEARAERERHLGQKQLAAPEGKFGVIVEDFEWDHVTWSELGRDRAAENHYPVSRDAHTATEIVERTKARFECAADDCVLWMWTTLQHAAIAMDVLRLRGFEYRSQYAWGKDKIGLGFWSREKHEILLIGVKGKIDCPAPGTQWDSLITAPRGEHSAKPEIFLEMIERYFPNLPKIELNRRGPARPGWSTWGNEAEPIDSSGAPLHHDRDTGEINNDVAVGDDDSRNRAGESDPDRHPLQPAEAGANKAAGLTFLPIDGPSCERDVRPRFLREATPADDGLGIPAFLKRAAPAEVR